MYERVVLFWPQVRTDITCLRKYFVVRDGSVYDITLTHCKAYL